MVVVGHGSGGGESRDDSRVVCARGRFSDGTSAVKTRSCFYHPPMFVFQRVYYAKSRKNKSPPDDLWRGDRVARRGRRSWYNPDGHIMFALPLFKFPAVHYDNNMWNRYGRLINDRHGPYNTGRLLSPKSFSLPRDVHSILVAASPQV